MDAFGSTAFNPLKNKVSPGRFPPTIFLPVTISMRLLLPWFFN